MRRKVPFVGEELIARAEDAQADIKKTHGRIIDDVLNTGSDASSWDDIVRAASSMDKARSSPGVSIPRQTHHGVPPTPGATLKKAIIESNMSSARIDWIPINNGHGLRINIAGSLDQNCRQEWRRLLNETANIGIDQFEFNMTQAPNLSLTGLGMLLLFREEKGSDRNDIKLCHCNKEVWQILQWTGMDKYFLIQGAPNIDN